MNAPEEGGAPTAPNEDANGRLVFRIDGAIHRALDRLWNRMQVAMADIRASAQDTPPEPTAESAASDHNVRTVNNPERCIDNSQTTTASAAPGGSVAQANARIEGEKVKGWFTNVLLAFNLLLMGACVWAWRHAAQEEDLKRYDLDEFVRTQFADVRDRVNADHELIQAYGLQKAVTDAARGAAEEKEIGRAHHHSR